MALASRTRAKRRSCDLCGGLVWRPERRSSAWIAASPGSLPRHWSADEEHACCTKRGIRRRFSRSISAPARSASWCSMRHTACGRRVSPLTIAGLAFLRGTPKAGPASGSCRSPKGRSLEEPAWIAVTDGQQWDDKPRWSPDGDLIYFTSLRDGFHHLWAQRLGPDSRQPIGPAFPVQHLHSARLSVNNPGLRHARYGSHPRQAPDQSRRAQREHLDSVSALTIVCHRSPQPPRRQLREAQNSKSIEIQGHTEEVASAEQAQHQIIERPGAQEDAFVDHQTCDEPGGRCAGEGGLRRHARDARPRRREQLLALPRLRPGTAFGGLARRQSRDGRADAARMRRRRKR